MRQSILTIVLATIIISIAMQSGTPAQDTKPSVDDARASLLETDRETSHMSPEQFAESLAPDVWFLMPDAERIQGREAFLEASASLFEMDLSFSPDEALVSEAGDFGVTIGTFHITDEGPDGKPMRRAGKYQTTWRRRDDGRWWIIADMYNFDAPLPASD